MARPNTRKNLIKQRILYCPDCDSIKELSEWYKNKSSKDSYDSICRSCRDIRSKANSRKNSKPTPAPQKASTVIRGIDPATPVFREVGQTDLHVGREQTGTGWDCFCNYSSTVLPLMQVRHMESLDVRRVCPTCLQTLVSAGFRLPSFEAAELRPGWSLR